MKIQIKHILALLLSCYLFLGSSWVQAKQPITLSLDEAILLAVRSNPNVQISKLNYLAQKFNLYVQEWEFSPHYSFQVSALATRGRTNDLPYTNTPNFNAQPTVSLLTPIGTQLSLALTNQRATHYNPSLSLEVVQPLLRGFGRPIVEAALNNARDTEVIAKLSTEGVLRGTVTAVIGAYLNVVASERKIIIDEEAVERAEKSVEQTRLFIKAGHKAGNELVTVKANVASAKSDLINDKNNLLQARYALLAAIGVDPNTAVKFTSIDIGNLINKYHLTPLDKAKTLILENDIQYQIDNITLNGSTTRGVLVAKDNTRWQLNLTANAMTGSGAGGGQNAGFNSLYNGVNQTGSIGFTLQVPINDQLSKQALLNAEIGLKQAKIALKKERWEKETTAINGWNLVISAKRALRFAEDAEKLQKQTYNLSYQKYLHGLIDSLELQTAQTQLIQSQQNLLGAQIMYIKSLIDFDLLIGNTLKTWNIKVRLQ